MKFRFVHENFNVPELNLESRSGVMTADFPATFSPWENRTAAPVPGRRRI